MSECGRVTEQHRRRAVVYVRQSTLHQVERNVESSARQYALKERAVELGWPAESVFVVDEDTGRSGARSEGRIGFKELVAEVGLGHVGLVLALEVSRLARSSADWHQLLDLSRSRPARRGRPYATDTGRATAARARTRTDKEQHHPEPQAVQHAVAEIPRRQRPLGVQRDVQHHDAQRGQAAQPVQRPVAQARGTVRDVWDR